MTVGGTKNDNGKDGVGLIDREALIQLAKVLDFGRRKYDAHNWRKGIEWQRIIDSALRHILAFNDNEDMDPESGLNHIAHAMCNCMFLLNYYKNHPELDNRYKEKSPETSPGMDDTNPGRDIQNCWDTERPINMIEYLGPLQSPRAGGLNKGLSLPVSKYSTSGFPAGNEYQTWEVPQVSPPVIEEHLDSDPTGYKE